jgi:predicted phosphodiesterase
VAQVKFYSYFGQSFPNRLKLANKIVYQNLDRLFKKSETVELRKNDSWVIFSDLHMGEGGSTDDFKPNADLFKTALESYYNEKKYALLLNGDIEELQRFSLTKIYENWKDVYRIFDIFQAKDKLVKTIGNHDIELFDKLELPFSYKHVEGFKLKHKHDYLFFYHGHQASKKFQKHNRLIGLTLKYFVNPLGIKNYSVAHSSRKQFKIEKRAYAYSAYRKVVSIIGHTHRPLFESMHKTERLKYKIEKLCREFLDAPTVREQEEIKVAIKSYKKDLKQYYRIHQPTNFNSYVYNTIFHIPCLFNSGCVIGKRGMTCLEVENGMIRLVHWFDGNINKKYLQPTGYEPERLGNTDYFRMIINEESLDYVFTRIKFLT